MIAYDLKCQNGHTFEGWFDDLASFEKQRQKGLISCPFCEDDRIERLPSTFAIKSSRPAKDYPEQAPNAELAQIGKQVVDYIEKNFDNVGSDFAKEALKIHYGAKEPRNIRGVSSDEEEKMLRKEGVKFMKVPMPASSDKDA